MINDMVNPVTEDVTSFLMIGQSNMAGRGDVGEVEPIENPQCYMLRNGRWIPMAEPINTDRYVFRGEYKSGVSLGASFADEYAKYYNKKIGLIPCADGGTSISQWMPGEILFDHAVLMTKLALRTSKFGGILWHQGENDCFETEFPLYKERFKIMISALRKKIGAEDLPVIIGELSENIAPQRNRGNYPQKMNEIFKELEREVSYCRLVSAKELPLKDDGIHFNSHSLRELGVRYFEAYRLLNDK